jgi:hypothetical protein
MTRTRRDPQDDRDPIEVARFAHEAAASALVAALAEQGVQAMMVGDFTAGFRAECPGEVGVYVRRADLEAAQSALANVQQAAAEIDWSQVDWQRPSADDVSSR